jgi:hypothetical protein
MTTFRSSYRQLGFRGSLEIFKDSLRWESFFVLLELAGRPLCLAACRRPISLETEFVN